MFLKSEFTIGSYKIFRNKIGKGTFSKIYKGISLLNKKEIAIKIIKKKNIKNEQLIQREIKVLQTLHHENIIKLVDVLTTTNRYYLIFNYCKYGDLKNYIYNEKPNLSEKEIQNLMIQLKNGLEYLYIHKIIHRDLKPQNILINENNILKISDFGFAKIYKNNNMSQTLCGSPLYMAPEILNYQKYTDLADLWSVGVILYEILFKETPIKGGNLYKLVQNIKKYNSQKDYILNHNEYTISVIDLVQKLLEKNPKQRLSWKSFLNHKWFNQQDFTKTDNDYEEFIFLMDEDNENKSNECIYNSNRLNISDNYMDTCLSLSEKNDSTFLIVSKKNISTIPRSMPKNRFTNLIASVSNSLSLLFISPNSI